MNDTVIKVENLSKQYRLGEHQGYKTFREAIVDAAKAPLNAIRTLFPSQRSPLRAPNSKLSSSEDTLWALDDVSFQVKQGEVVGIIGRNGAGKSTLLKVLSKITEPTRGRVSLKGRIGALLEVGTGFHPELTGHENIYLYGAILGMDRWEVTRKFDEIVNFAELERFIETPVKRYSSGMYTRLAFSVAAHLDPEILLVDEVLAVGDLKFQKKCLGKMDSVAKKGRTVLFVSHNMASILRLCQRCLLLDNGRKMAFGETKEIVNKYVALSENLPAEWINKDPDTSDVGRMLSIRIIDNQEKLRSDYHRDEEVLIELKVELYTGGDDWAFRIDLIREGVVAFRSSDFDDKDQNLEGNWEPGIYKMYMRIPPKLLNYGSYDVVLHFGLYDKKIVYETKTPLLSFQILKDIECNHFVSKIIETKHPGVVYPALKWNIIKSVDESKMTNIYFKK